RDRGVEVALGGGTAATRCGAGRVAGPDQMAQLAARLITGLLVTVVAGILGQGVDRHGEGAGAARGGRRGAGAGCGRETEPGAGGPAAGASVAEGVAVFAGDGEAVAGGGVGGLQLGQ